MNFLNLFKKLSNITAISFTAYVIYNLGINPLLNLLGINLIYQPQLILENLLLTLTLIIAAMAFILIITGYLIFTGWKHRSEIPLIFKFLIIIILGLFAFILAAPISMFVKFPFVPLIISATLLWIILRIISNQIDLKRSVEFSTIIKKLKDLDNNLEINEAKLNKNEWIIYAKKNDKLIEYKFDAKTGELKTWKQI